MALKRPGEGAKGYFHTTDNRIAIQSGMSEIQTVKTMIHEIAHATLHAGKPMGAHDLGGSSEDICIRFAQPGDTFLPFGGEAEEIPDSGEVVYAVGHQVRTRRWTWRQSEHGKITPESTDIFFPIDGFTNFNREQVLAARDDLKTLVKQISGCEAAVGFVDSEHQEMEL